MSSFIFSLKNYNFSTPWSQPLCNSSSCQFIAVSKNAIFTSLKPGWCYVLMQQLSCYISAKNLFLTLGLKFALICEICSQILYWSCSFCQKNHSSTAGIFLPNWIKLLNQGSQYHQSLSLESYYILEQESIPEPESFSPAGQERWKALHNLCDSDTSWTVRKTNSVFLKIEVTLILVP